MSDAQVQVGVVVNSEEAEKGLNRVGTAAEGMSRKVEASANQAGKAVDNIGSGAAKGAEEFNRAEGKIVASIKRATTQLEQLGKTASQKLEMKISAQGLDAAKFEPMLAKLRELEAAQNRVVTSSRSFGGGLQNTSYQLQDFIVQVNGGTDATRALSMQLPQMLVGFGAAGAAIGVVASLLPNLIQAFGNAGESSKKFSDAMSDFDKAVSDVGSTVKTFDMEKLYEQFNQSSDAVRNATIEQLRFQQEYIKTTQLVASKKFGESLGGFGEFTTLDKLSGSFNGAEKLAKQLGLSVETAKDLMPVLKGLKSGSEDVNLAFNRFGTALLGGNAQAVELAQTMATLSKSERDAAAASSALSEAQDKMAKGHVTTKKEVEDAAKARKESARAAEAEAKALETLLDTINGKDSGLDSSYVKNVETLLAAYDKGKLSLSGFNEVFSRYVAMQPGAIAAARELAKAEESRSKYLASVEDETEKLVEKAKASEYELSLIGKSADEIGRLTAARYDEKIELLQDKIAAIESLEGRNAEVEAIERQIDALQRLKSAEIVKPKLQAQAREWENFARDIERSLTDALYRSFESGGSFADNFAKTLENTIKTALAKALIQATMTTSANALNGVINAISGTYGENGGAGRNYFGLANNANSVYNLGSAAVNTYSALTTGAGAISGTATLANIYGAAGGDSLGAFIAMNPQWTSAASSAGAAAGAEAGAAAGSASASAASAASYAGYAAALYQAYKGDYASASLTGAGTYIGSMFGPWGAAIGALAGTLVGSFIQSGGGPKDNSRYNTVTGESYGSSASLLAAWSNSAKDTINYISKLYGGQDVISKVGAWLSTDHKGTANTQLGLSLHDENGNWLYDRGWSYGGNIENAGRSSESIQQAMEDTLRDSILMTVERLDIGPKVVVSFFDKFASGIDSLSAERSSALVSSLTGNWLDKLIANFSDDKLSLEGVADAANRLISIWPLKSKFDEFGVSIFAIGAQTEATLPALASLKKTITGTDGVAVTETFRETYLRTVNEFVAVGNMLDAMGLKVSEAFDMSNVNNVLAMSDALVQLFGTVEDMGKSFNAYYENFYSAAEKNARSWELMQRSFDGLGLSMPKTREEFRKLVEGLDLNTSAGVQTFKALMDLQSAFSALTPSVDDLASTAASAAAQIAAQKSAMLEMQGEQITSYVEAIQSQKTAAQQAIIESQTAIAQAASSSAQTMIDAFKQIVNSLTTYRDNLIGTNSGGDQQRYASARAAFIEVSNKAKLGDQEAAQKLQSVSDAFLAASKNVSSASGYASDYGMVLGTVDSVIGVAERQIPIAEQQLNVAQAQLASLQSIQASLSSAGAPSSSSLPVVVSNYQQASKDWTDWFANTQIGSSQKWDIGTTTRLSDSLGMFIDNAGNAFTFSQSDGFYGLAKKSSAFAESLKRLYGSWSMPSFAVGADYLPKDMIAQVHEGERIIPAADNARLINALSGDSAMASEIRALRQEVSELRSEQRAGQAVIAANTASAAKVLNKFDYDGMPEVRAA